MARGKELRLNSRVTAPCKGCTERYTACSDHCPKDTRGEFGYKAWKQEVEEIVENHKTYLENRVRRKIYHGKK
jgi:hypothetical protein